MNAAGESREPACVACGGRSQFFGTREGYAYFRCVACGTLQLEPMPSREELQRAYHDQYAKSGHIATDPAVWTAAAAPHYRGVLRALQAHGARGRVVDYGGGWGGLCAMLRTAGFDARVVEPSRQMADYCREKNIPVVHGEVGDIPGRDYDAFALVGVFEHLIEHRAWLAQARELIRPGGLLVVMQPTAKCAAFLATLVRFGRQDAELPALHQTFCPPWHTALFSIEGMRRLAESAGFELVEVRPGLQGRSPGLLGLAQRTLQLVNRMGWALAGRSWPLNVTHIFVFKRV